MSLTYDSIIEQVVQSVFATMLNMELVRSDEPAEPSDTLLATIQITGTWVGSVVLALPRETSLAVASAMLQIAESEVGEPDRRDVAAELVNMIGGNLKSMLPGPSYLSLPTIVSGRDVGLQVHDANLIEQVSLASASGSIHIQLFQHSGFSGK